MNRIVRKDKGKAKEILDGIWIQNLAYGDKTHMVRFLLEKGKHLPLHKHSEEQTGYLIRGEMDLIIDGIKYRVKKGDSWSIKGGIPHEAYVIETCEALEIFSPVREDYLKLD